MPSLIPSPQAFAISKDDLEILINDIDKICSFVINSSSSEDINLALDAFDKRTQFLASPRPRIIVMLYLSLIGMLSCAIERENQKNSLPGIYIIEYSNKSVKIGMTSFFDERIKQLSYQGGLTITRSQFFYCKNSGKAESEAHKKFKKNRLNGEFFEISYDEAISEIEILAFKNQ